MIEALYNPNVEAEVRKQYKSVVCPMCESKNTIHDTTIYYKCCWCGEGISVEKGLINKDAMVVVDYGKTGDSMWVEVQDSDGNICTYWKEG